ncbi:PREDICTED: uncharacterized protein LOC109170754 [Ipomoea nil]|uniref:uncharacterized protein LOC109170754 n=1 Tax=Ipomoea nil TaxID=35883 RepID=UPI000900E2C4|nr:PREDICTED: uncharacterized protein LOC109170754 [Ipomoea nil]
MVAGDFNSVITRDETNNYVSFSAQRSSDFVNWINEEGFVDMGYSGPKLTWVKHETTDGAKGARLDRAMCNLEWRGRYPEAVVEHLPRVASDHAPLLIRLYGRQCSNRLNFFHFQAAWITHQDLQQVVGRIWIPEENLADNVRRVADGLSSWNRDVFGNVYTRKRSLRKLERNLQTQLEETLYQEELMWYQRSREEWIKSGDRNTKFYHAAATVRKSRIKISGLNDDNGMWMPDGNELRDHVRTFFLNLFTEPTDGVDVSSIGDTFPRIGQTTWRVFNREVSKEEVYTAVFDMKPFKAPGPDGLPAGFYQHTWEVTGDSIFKLVRDALSTGRLSEGVNDTLVALIPKVQVPETVKQFRPISLCNVGNNLERRPIGTVHTNEGYSSKRRNVPDYLCFVYGTAQPPNCVKEIAAKLGIAETKDLGRYLGVPSLHGRVTCNTYAGLLDRISARLEGWKAKTLSLAGRVTLAKSVLKAIPIYTMQTAALPKGVCSEIEKRTRRFIWGRDEQSGSNKMILVAWDTITTDKTCGGLGLRKLQTMNEACMMKLCWRLKTEPNALWEKTLITKYHHSSGSHLDTTRRRNTSNAWKGISAARETLESGLTHVVRNGKSTRFWMDPCLTPKPLYEKLCGTLSLPDLYANVEDYWDKVRGWKWEKLQRSLPTEEMERLAGFCLADENIPDGWGWSPDPRGYFSIKSAYGWADTSVRQEVDKVWGLIWALRVPDSEKTWITYFDAVTPRTVFGNSLYSDERRRHAQPRLRKLAYDEPAGGL